MSRATHRDIVVFLLSVSLGAAIWLLAPAITGQAKSWTSGTGPWDMTYYRLALFLAGVLPSMVVQRGWWRWPAGIVLGQALVTIPSSLRSEFGCLGWAYMFPYVLYCLPGVAVGALLGYFGRLILGRRGSHEQDLAEDAVLRLGAEDLDRRASRLVVLDESGRVLLFQYRHPTGELFWATPGGGLEDGESFEQAGAREAVEELGAERPELQALWQGVAVFRSGTKQQERFFLLKEPGIDLDISVKGRQEEGVLQVRWWTLRDIETTSEELFPEDLAARLRERLET